MRKLGIDWGRFRLHHPLNFPSSGSGQPMDAAFLPCVFCPPLSALPVYHPLLYRRVQGAQPMLV
jgi:hypothetical protein